METRYYIIDSEGKSAGNYSDPVYAVKTASVLSRVDNKPCTVKQIEVHTVEEATKLLLNLQYADTLTDQEVALSKARAFVEETLIVMDLFFKYQREVFYRIKNTASKFEDDPYFVTENLINARYHTGY